MGRIDRSKGQDKTLEYRHIERMLRYMSEYEEVKKKSHKIYKTAAEFYEGKGICKQNFLKYYRRYLNSGREVSALIPHKTGRKFKDIIKYEDEIRDSVADLRQLAYNKYEISLLLKKRMQLDISPTTIYRLMVKLGINKLNPRMGELKRKIIKMSAGELGHIDVHYVAKDSVKELGSRKLYLLGIIDSYSRILWLKPYAFYKSYRY